MKKSKHICKCQDSLGHICGKEMSQTQYKQDGMCSFCADNCWEETIKQNHKWFHTDNPKNYRK